MTKSLLPPPHHQSPEALVSVIVPVYNVALYIEQCLQSLLEQTFSAIEIICIDDGSTDTSNAIIKEHMKRDSRIVLYTQENKGPSSARNCGLRHAHAPYIMFCDPDDYYTPKAIECMYTAMTLHDVDIVSGKIYILDERKRRRIKQYPSIGLMPLEEGKFNVQPRDFSPAYWSQCSKLFKHSIIKEHNLSFPEHIQYGEDLQFSYIYLSLCKSIYYIQSPTYYYRYRKGSATHMAKDATNLPELAIQPLESVETVLRFIEKLGKLEEYIQILCSVYLDQFSFALTKTPTTHLNALYTRARDFLDSIQNHIHFITSFEILQEIVAIQSGYLIHSILRENRALQNDITILRKKSILYKLRLAKYYLFSKLPIRSKEHYRIKYANSQYYGK